MAAPGRATDQTGISDPSLVRFRALVEAGLAELEARREEVNDLNVFPVADGDTGDNMVLTLRAVLTELDRLAGASEGRTIDEIGRDEIVDSVARAALLGARGNSGVILSQLIRGAAEELISRPGELVDPVLIGAAMARAADRAYGSVRDPAEGTILTVVREMAHRVASELAHIPDARLERRRHRGGAGHRHRQRDRERAGGRPGVGQARPRPAAGAARGGRRGRRRLRADRAAGRDRRRAARRRAAAARASRAGARHPPPARLDARTATARTSRSPAPASSSAATSAELEKIGDSVLVVGDQTTLKVHVHTDEPDAATASVRRRRRRLAPRRRRHARAGPAPRRAAGGARGARRSAACWRSSTATGWRELFDGFGPRACSTAARR